MKSVRKFGVLGLLSVLFAFLCVFSQEIAFATDKVLLGGRIVGFSLPIGGAQIVGFKDVETEDGVRNSDDFFDIGDIITDMDGVKIEKTFDVTLYLTNLEKSKSVEVTFWRNGNKIEKTVVPFCEKYSGTNKLGIYVRDSIEGLGTLTYIDGERFGALGHAAEFPDVESVLSNNGTLYDGVITGVEKGTRGKAGSINGYLSSENIGIIDKNCKFGLYGKSFITDGEEVEIVSRNEVKPGKAQICSYISGQKEFYDVEITRAMYQRTEADKGLIIKVKDDRLISLTGGIVQGMSGSPILQNGKIVGAVTHVFVNDPTRGYGIYLDWMMDN
jgi:stage IV sporulation protein B